MVRQDSLAAQSFIDRQLSISIAEPFIGLVIERDLAIVGAIILNDFTRGRNIEITAAATGPWSIADIRDVLRYCFARAERITARTHVNNFQAIKRLNMLGFKYEGRMRRFFENGDAAVFGLLRSEQRIVRL